MPALHNCFTALWILSGTTQVSQYQKKHSPTHIYRSHQSSLNSASSIYYNPQHPPCSMYVPDSLFSTISLLFLWSASWPAPSTSYYINFFIQSLSLFHSTCPYHHNLFCCSTENMSSNPSLCLKPLLGTLSCSLMPHIHLTILISVR